LVQSHDMEKLKRWFLEEKRELPWRNGGTPYAIWVSEVMLQQTQVAVVIPYYLRWMEKFPTLESLANASIEEVIKMWEGLGYYSRARNMHKAAIQIVQNHQGIFPSTPNELAALPGFGPYTVGAVLSFAFRKKAPAVDGNVVRVLSRFFATKADPTKRAHYEDLTLKLLPNKEPWIVMEALIELGATVCQKQPKCLLCPLLDECKAYSIGNVHAFPTPKKRPLTIQLNRQVALITNGACILIKQEKGKKVMSGLYEFPYALIHEPLPVQLELIKLKDFPVVKHGFTRYDVTLFPSLYKTEKKEEVPGYEWHTIDKLTSLPFSSGHRRILKDLHAHFAH
jgi:A/G-specific adenine glycosylase